MLSAKKVMWLVLLLCLVATARAQHPCYLKLNRQDGLPSDAVYNVFQDSRGYIWMATGEGLCRYDGFEFVSYKSAEQTSLPGSCIQEDRYGRIWYENFDGYLYYTDSGRLKSMAQRMAYYYVPFGISSHHLFITSNKGVDVYDITTLKLIKNIEIPRERWVNAVASGNAYYALSDSIIYKINDDLQIDSCWLPASVKPVLHNIYAAADGVYVTSINNADKQLFWYNSHLELVKAIPVQQPMAIQYVSAIDNDICINTPLGSNLYTIDATTGVRKATYFDGKSISGVIKDRQNNLWFSTTNEGLFIVPDRNTRRYTTGSNVISKIVTERNGYYVGTQKGELLRLNKDFEDAGVVCTDPGNSGIYYLYADDQNIVYSSVGFTIVSAENKKEVQRNLIALKEIVRVDEKYYAFASSVYCGLLLNPAADPAIHSVWDSAFAKGMKSFYPHIASLVNLVRAKSVAYDSGSRQIFFATNKGVFCVSPDTVTTITANGQPVFANALQVANGTLYALSSMGVVQKIPYATPAKASGYKSMPLTGISLMKRFGNELYLFGGGALYRLELGSDTAKRLEIRIDIHGINDILKQDDKLYIVTNDGVIALNRESTATNRKPALFYINYVTANGKPLNASIQSELRYFENNIAVNFSVLDFGTVAPVSAFYRLNNSEWKEIARGARSLQFPALSAGNYTLSFRLGQAGNTVQSVQFSIQPAFWEQWWFYLICLTGIFLLIFAYYKMQISTRIRKLEAQKKSMQLEQDLGKSMLTSIRAQMNPHFFYNALNTIQAYIFMNDKIRANNYLAKFSRLTRTILEMSEAENVSLSDEAETMSLYLELEKMRFDSSFEYRISFEGIENKEMIEIPSMIIQPYVENAIKHGLLHKTGDKILNISFVQQHKALLVTIDDNGIGRKRSEELNRIKAEKYRSFSTKASEKRIELLNKGRIDKIIVEITDKVHPNGSAAGTRILLKLPI